LQLQFIVVYLNFCSVLGWWHSIVIRTLVSAGKLSLSCTRLLSGWVTTLRLSG